MMQTTDLAPARIELTESDNVKRMLDAGTLVLDARRVRALFFNGRFLSALDLTRERDYVLQRQSDLMRAGGTGVATGLFASGASGTTTVTISSGFGVTPSGELVTLPGPDLTVDLADVPDAERLNAAFGLNAFPSNPMRNRTGLYVLALRPVEFTANPIASYPTSLQGTRSVQDGDVIEATAVTLIPFLEQGRSANAFEARARAAARIFASPEALDDLSVSALPIAMVMIDGGLITWVDSFMVRREIGAEHEDTVGLGLSPRALREAYLLQYDQHLSDLMTLTQNGRFAASDHFLMLPPAGRMPTSAIDTRTFTQIFFPSQLDVELSIVPEDELPMLLEESMLLAPIDLTNADELASTSVLVLVPKPRTEVRRLEGQLQSLQRQLKAVAPGLLAQRKPIDILRGLLVQRQLTPVLDPTTAINKAWSDELTGVPFLYFVRRRHLAFKASISGVPIEVGRDEVADEAALTAWVTAVAMTTQFTAIKTAATAPAIAEIVHWLSSPEFNPATTTSASSPFPATSLSPVLLLGAILDLKQVVDGLTSGTKLTRSLVLGVEQKYADPDLGVGLSRIGAAWPPATSPPATDPVTLAKSILPQTHQVPALDKVGRLLPFPPDPANQFQDFMTALVTAVTQADTTRRLGDSTTLIVNTLKLVEQT
jgi:hypothetical protein